MDIKNLIKKIDGKFSHRYIKGQLLIQEDCLKVLKLIDSESIHFVLSDTPYGTSFCKWDSIIPLEPMWKEIKRIIKKDRAICLFGTQPFTTKLISSNIDMFKYELIWDKVQGKQPLLAKIQPMKSHENILVFGKSKVLYNPQMTSSHSYTDPRKNQKVYIEHFKSFERQDYFNKSSRYPVSILRFNNYNKPGRHPTEKPVPLFENLINTYSNEGDLILDFTAGSFVTSIACMRNKRRSICIELDENYYNKGVERVYQESRQDKFDF